MNFISQRGRQNLSDECPCPRTPYGNIYRGHLSDPQQRWGPPSPLDSTPPKTAKRRLHYSSSPETEESMRSFAFGEEESVYDDTLLVQRRRQAERGKEIIQVSVKPFWNQYILLEYTRNSIMKDSLMYRFPNDLQNCPSFISLFQFLDPA